MTTTMPLWLNPAAIPAELPVRIAEADAMIREAAEGLIPLLRHAQDVLSDAEDAMRGLPDEVFSAAYEAIGGSQLHMLMHAVSEAASPDIEVADRRLREMLNA